MAGNLIINHSEREERHRLQRTYDHDLFDEGEMSAMVERKLVDIQAGNAHGVRSFLVNFDGSTSSS